MYKRIVLLFLPIFLYSNIIDNTIKARIDYYKCIDNNINYKKLAKNVIKIKDIQNKRNYIYKYGFNNIIDLSGTKCQKEFLDYKNYLKRFYNSVDKQNLSDEELFKIIMYSKADNLFYDVLNQYLSTHKIFNVADPE